MHRRRHAGATGHRGAVACTTRCGGARHAERRREGDAGERGVTGMREAGAPSCSQRLSCSLSVRESPRNEPSPRSSEEGRGRRRNSIACSAAARRARPVAVAKKLQARKAEDSSSRATPPSDSATSDARPQNTDADRSAMFFGSKRITVAGNNRRRSHTAPDPTKRRIPSRAARSAAMVSNQKANAKGRTNQLTRTTRTSIASRPPGQKDRERWIVSTGLPR
jgi:hypothetical protein